MDEKEKEVVETTEEVKETKVKKNNKEVKEVKVEKVTEEKEEKFFEDKKFSILKAVWNVVFWGVFLVFIALAAMAYMDYNKLDKDEEPTMYSSMEEYKLSEDGEKLDKNASEGDNVTVYNYYLYKIVEHYDGGKRQFSLKLWFLDDVNQD